MLDPVVYAFFFPSAFYDWSWDLVDNCVFASVIPVRCLPRVHIISGNTNQVELKLKFKAVNNNIVNLKRSWRYITFSYDCYLPPNIGHILNIIIYGIPNVSRTWSALYMLTWTCASRHSGLQLFISHLPSFSDPTFRPSGATRHWKKHTVWRLVYLFRAPASSFFWLFLFSGLLSSAFLFSDSSHLCFSSVNFVGSLTCKLPLIIRKWW